MLRASCLTAQHLARSNKQFLPSSLCRAISTHLSLTSQQALEAWNGYGVGIERAQTLPASWYTSAVALQLEKQHILYNTWQAVCDVSRLQQPGDYICGTLADVRYLIVRSQDGQLRAFHNVCRHHAAAVAEGCGNQQQFTCPYHNWTYDDRGRLVKATRLKGIQEFRANQFGLHPILLDTWGHLVFIHLQGGKPAAAAVQPPASVADWLGAGGQRMQQLGMSDNNLIHLARRQYVLNCNWKVFCDNYLDGGYHVPYAHKDLASGLDLSGYNNELYDVLSIQVCAVKKNTDRKNSNSGSSAGSEAHAEAAAAPAGAAHSASMDRQPLDRLASGRDAGYAFVYPNLMINRYGPWMDTNVVLPLSGKSVDQCKVVFDYWLEAEALQQAAESSSNLSSIGDCSSRKGLSAGSGLDKSIVAAALQSAFVQDSLQCSHKVQEEDIALCEAVQLGLQEPAYGVGRYAPGPEAPMYHFHSLLYGSIMSAMEAQQRQQQ